MPHFSYYQTKRYYDMVAVEMGGYSDPRTAIAYSWQQAAKDAAARFITSDFNRILDGGCGMGDFTFTLAEQWPESDITGVDVSYEMIKLCERTRKEKRLKNVNFQCADLFILPFRNCEFDLTVCLGVLPHILQEDWDRIITEFARVSAQSVIVQIVNRVTPLYWAAKISDRIHRRHRIFVGSHRKTIEMLWRRNGFELSRAKSIYVFRFFPILEVLKFDRKER